MSYSLAPLPYEYGALEPYIDERTLHFHHDKHHQTYVNNLNAALEGHDDLAALPVEDLLAHLDRVPESIRTAVQNNGGGHANHSLYWQIMGPNGGGEAGGSLARAVARDFGGFEAFKERLSKAASARFGSGWAWLSLDDTGTLLVEATANQDTPLSEGRTPLLTLDVWEHAYYLQYQNRRPDYIAAWWNAVNWIEVNRRFEVAGNRYRSSDNDSEFRTGSTRVEFPTGVGLFT